jgi:GT2 family glycosyltransferase
MDDISVIVVNWNQKELLRACLRSILAQEGVQFEIIVVDNGSTDGSVEMVEGEFQGEQLDASVALIRNAQNRGFCAATNQGIWGSKGDFIALLNNDAEAGPDWLKALRGAFERRPEIGMAACKILTHENPRRIDKVGHLIYLDGQNRGRASGEWDHGQYDRVEEILWPDGCAAMYRRTMLDRIGGFDEDFFAYADDAELGLRAQIAGWKCLYIPDAVVRHRRGATLGLRSARRLELIERNRLLLAAKLFPWSLLWLNGMYHATRLAAGVWAAALGRGETGLYPGWRGKALMITAMAHGDWQALRMLPLMLRKRREIARIRALSPREVRRLLLAHRISLRELSGQSTAN